MQRKDFLKNGLVGLGTIIGIPTVLTRCAQEGQPNVGDCAISPRETAGPFPIKTPSDLVRANIISDRSGIALLMTITVQDQSDDCNPLAGVFVDVWHCDSEGYYSEYGNNNLQSQDFTQQHFLRGRQTTDANGQVSFISIYPGWYPGRAPHIHIEVLDSNENSLLVSQIAFPEDISEEVYATTAYNGSADTTNRADNIFADSLERNMGTITGNTIDGYTLLHTLMV